MDVSVMLMLKRTPELGVLIKMMSFGQNLMTHSKPMRMLKITEEDQQDPKVKWVKQEILV